ncbi:MAG: diguanylate cyclase [Ectothiorhodospiraceae bacterium]|nr:diguanylate cyclase [Chromatiales bacterium]MCP5156325.1 diguanylate cyclase [Ectothiorhodospiraceae bacterium]
MPTTATPSIAELAKLDLFESVELRTVASLLRGSPVRSLAAGDLLISAGEPNRFLYLVLSGRLSVRLRSPQAAPITWIGPGETVGELSLIDRAPASAYVVVEQAARVVCVDEDLTWMLVDTSHAVASNLLRLLARRLRLGNEMLSDERDRLAEYRFHATVDGLTGLFNRYWLDRMLPRQIERSRATGESLALVMVDVDHFKRINDDFGHPAGDRVLRQVADILRDNLRPADMAARYGGEEFALLLPGCGLRDALALAERLRRAVESMPWPESAGPAPGTVTISAGVGTMDDVASAEQLVARSDDALYRAKRAGRNRVAT